MSAFVGACALRGTYLRFDATSAFFGNAPGLETTRSWKGPGAFLHHRQRIVTPEDRFERQPLSAADGSAVMVFDGRLDDRSGLCETLGIADRSDLPDGEIAVRAVDRWGIEAPKHIIGDFAYAVWRPGAHELLMASTQHAARTLYYHRDGDQILFTTSLMAMLATPGIPHDLDEAKLSSFLAYDHTAYAQTIYQSILRVLPGFSLRLLPDGREDRYFFAEPGHGRLRLKRDEDYVEAARETLERVVASHLRSIKPVPILGSGGYDSACIAGAVAAIAPAGGFELFSQSPLPGTDHSAVAPDRYPDEAPYVRAMAAALPGGSARICQADPESDHDFWGGYDETGLPSRASEALRWVSPCYRAMQQGGAVAALGGHLGNMTLTWDGSRGMADQFWSGNWAAMLSNAIPIGEHEVWGTLRILAQEVVRPLIPQAMRPNQPGDFTWMTDHAMGLLPPQKSGYFDRSYYGSRTSRAWRVDFLEKNTAWETEAHQWVRSKYGIEGRFPLVDRRMIDFALSVPVEQYIRRGKKRWLATRLMAALGIPPEITQRTSRGRWLPDWFMRLDRRHAALRQHVASLRSVPLATRLIDLDRLDNILDNWPDNPREARLLEHMLGGVLMRSLDVGTFAQWAEESALTQHRGLKVFPNG